MYRGVAQLVARLVRDQEAMGSNPVTSTTTASDAVMSQQKGNTFVFPFLLLPFGRTCLVGGSGGQAK